MQVPKFKNSAPGPNHAPFAGILPCVRLNLPRSSLFMNQIRRLYYTYSRFTEGGLKFKKNATLTLTRLLVGYFAKIYLYTKFDISSFIRSRFTEGVLKFIFWSLTLTTPF